MCVNPNDPIFYVYVYLDPRKPGHYVYGEYEFDYEPFYVGKGCNGRAYVSHKENIDLFNKINEIIDPIIVFYKEGLVEYTAFRLECKIIKVIGRRNVETGPLYNLLDECGGGMTGHSHTEETKKKMSNAWKNRLPTSEETRKKMSEANKGRIVSEETRQKLSKAGKGRKLTDKHKQKLIDAHRGRKLTDEHKRKIGEGNRGKKYTDETKRKMSDARKNISDETRQKLREAGKNISDETRQKRSKSMTGKKLTEETKKKISESKKKSFRKKGIYDC